MSLINLLPIIIILGGTFVLVRLRAFYVFHPIRTLKAILFALNDRKARTSLFLAMGGTLGIGNIVGVAVGISVGGAGSVLWLVLSSVFAMALKYAESSLAADLHTSSSDGMMSVLSASFPRLGRKLSYTYAALCVLLSLVMGAALQSSGVISCASVASLNPLFVGFVFSAAVFGVLVCGPERVGGFTAVIIPITTVIYIFLALTTIFFNISRLPSVLCDVILSAFTPNAAVGGVVGFITSTALREGFSRGLLSNEAGAGTSSLAHSRISDNPATAGLLGMCEVFFDTVLLCPLTAIAILVSAPDLSSTSGMSLVLSTIGSTLGNASSVLVTVCIASFAFSTVICWYCYGSRCLSFLRIRNLPYMLIYVGATLLGVFFSEHLLITVTDYVLMTLTVFTTCGVMKNSDRLRRLSENAGLFGNSK